MFCRKSAGNLKKRKQQNQSKVKVNVYVGKLFGWFKTFTDVIANGTGTKTPNLMADRRSVVIYIPIISIVKLG